MEIPSNNHFFKNFFNFSTDMCFIGSRDGFCRHVNDTVGEVLGYSKSEILATALLDLIHPEDAGRTQEVIKLLAEGGRATNFIAKCRHRAGHYLTLSWFASFHEDGHFYATARNVSEEMNVGNRLQAIERALQKASILVETDTRGVIIEANEQFCEISGYSREELIGNSHRLVNSGHHPKAFFQDIWRTISSGGVWKGTIKNRAKNGEHYYVHTIITSITDHTEKISGYIAVRNDITDSVETKESLLKTADVLNETSAIAKVGGWELDVASGELSWTDETFKILEVKKQEGTSPMLPEGLSLFIPEHQKIIEHAVENAIVKGESYSLELKAQTAKGNVLWVYTTGSPNYKSGEVVSLSGTIQDINARKEAELQCDVERQRSFHNAKLRSLGELAASMAHEINNPLSIISGYAELTLLHADQPDKVGDGLNAILKSCDRISHIMKNLKKFSRDSGTSERKLISLKGIVNEAISLATPRAKTQLIPIVFESHSSGKVVCNEIEIEQVILNLINNAIDAVEGSDDRWIKIDLIDRQESLDIKVIDSGGGLPSDIVSSIFEPFYTTKGVEGGTGLGLSIIADLAGEHGGRVYYEPESPNTCFVVELPRAE